MTVDAAARSPRVFTIPPGAAFLETLADALLDGHLIPGYSRADGPLDLAAATIYVPTRRSARALAAVLAQRLGTASVLLPRIVPLGALDDTEQLFDDGGMDGGLSPDLPVAIGDIARRMILARLILAWGEAVGHAIVSVDAAGGRRLSADEPLLVATSPADAWHLSGDLGRLIDDLSIEAVEWAAMKPLGTAEFDRYWAITLDFLTIAIAQYPVILDARGQVDRVTRQLRLIEAEVARLDAGRHGGPVVVAGSTGSSKATGRLIGAVSRLPQGAVVLPGLDQGLDDAAWAAIGLSGDDQDSVAGHPQAQLRRLLADIGIDRESVVPLGDVPPPRVLRGRLVSEALRPAATTHLWQRLSREDHAAALDGILLIEAGDEREEALAIAVALREALETPGTAALVTPDRTLARRVREELTRWGIDIEDSSGEPLGQTPAGTLARLVLDCALKALSPIEILAVLHHPDVRLGRPRPEVRRLARRLETAILRGVLPPRPLHDPEALLAQVRAARGMVHASRALKAVDEDGFVELGVLLADLLTALEPLQRISGEMPLPVWLDAHETVLAALLNNEQGAIESAGPGYAVLTELFEELDEAADPAITLDCPGYGALFDRLVADKPVRGPARSHPRIKILGLLEARLLATDRIILGGLDEAIWPPQVRTDAFLNRPMRAALGLTPPERRISLSAHDFETALGQPEVLITRSAKRGGAPTVPSRFLQRLAAVAGEAWGACGLRGQRYVALARALERPPTVAPILRPAPRPDLELRPTSLSVTRIEVLRRDPYSIYAERILKLKPLETLGAAMGPRDFGTLFHAAIAAHSTEHRSFPLPPEAALMLGERLRQAFAGPLEQPGFRAFHWPRIERWTRAFLAWDAGRRAGVAHMVVEEKGRLPIRLADGSTFELRAEADRIEIDAQGRITLIDFKTGTPPGLREVKAGFAPQLTLEAEMVAQGAFPSIPRGAVVGGALYVKFGNTDEVRATDLHWKDDPPFAEIVALHRDELVALLNSFLRLETGYMARPFPKFASRYGEYDHLSRFKEWSATGGADDGGADG